MTRGDWVYIGVSNVLAESIDNFLKSDDAKNMDLKNRQQFVNRLIIDFFRKYRENRGIAYIKFPMYSGVLDLVDSKPKKIKK
jgi:hypothetical protein